MIPRQKPSGATSRPVTTTHCLWLAGSRCVCVCMRTCAWLNCAPALPCVRPSIDHDRTPCCSIHAIHSVHSFTLSHTLHAPVDTTTLATSTSHTRSPEDMAHRTIAAAWVLASAALVSGVPSYRDFESKATAGLVVVVPADTPTPGAPSVIK
jgi:hypothetical protein